MKKVVFFCVLCTLMSCSVFHPNEFSNLALNDNFITVKGDSISLKKILNSNNDKLIQVYASYCPASSEGINQIEKAQETKSNKKYIFLSVDHSFLDFKRALKDIKAKGDYYFIPDKGRGDFAKFIKLKNTPRFLKVDKNNKIKVYKSNKLTNRLK